MVNQWYHWFTINISISHWFYIHHLPSSNGPEGPPRPRLPYFRNRLCMEAACWKFGLDTKDIYLLFQDSNWVFEGFNWVPNVDARNCLFCFLWNTEQVQKLPRFRKLGGTKIGILPLDLSDSLVNDWNITKFDRFCLFSAHVCALYRYSKWMLILVWTCWHFCLKCISNLESGKFWTTAICILWYSTASKKTSWTFMN